MRKLRIRNRVPENRDEDRKKFEVERDRLFECILRIPKRDGSGRKIIDLSDNIPEMEEQIFRPGGEEPAKDFIKRKKDAWKEELVELKAELDKMSSFIPEEEKSKLEIMLGDVEGCFDTGKEHEQIWKLYMVKDRIKWLKRLKKALELIKT